jgi:hypothetical protein
VTGAIAGAVGGALGKIGGKLLVKAAPKAMKVVGGLFGKGATEAEETAAADATEAAASRADSEGAGSRAQSHSDEAGPSCRIPSLPQKAARKAAFGLAASAAVLGVLSGGHADQQATQPVAAVSTADGSAAQDAHL